MIKPPDARLRYLLYNDMIKIAGCAVKGRGAAAGIRCCLLVSLS